MGQILWHQLLKVSRSAKGGLQAQLVASLVDAILTGKIPPSTTLPSSRTLSEALGLSRNTVVLAYQQLVDEGFLLSRERRGYYVDPEILSGRVTARKANIEAQKGTTPPDWQSRFRLRPSLDRNIEKPDNWNEFEFPFICGQIDPGLFPVADWRQCVRQASSLSGIREASTDYIDRDDETLVEQLRRKVLPRRGIWAEPENILITLGTQNALYLISELLVQAGTRVGMEDPGYPDARNIFAGSAGDVVPLPLDGDGLVPSDALARCDYIYATPSHQSPTTVTMSLERRHALLALATRDDFVIIEDDYEPEMTFGHEPLPALASLDTNERVIYVTSLSKTLAPGLRLGVMVAPAALIKEARALRRLVLRHPPASIQHTVALFLEGGHFDAYVKRLNAAYKSRRDTMAAALEEHLPGSTRSASFGGTSFWIEAKPHLDVKVLTQRCLEKSILIEPGAVYFSGENPPGNTFRLGFSSIKEEKIEPGVKLIGELMDELL